MTINLTDVTFDLLVVEQLHDIVPCDARECGRTAHWCYVHSCGAQWFSCNPHREKHDATREAAKALGWNRLARCCNGNVPMPTPWVAL